MRSAFVVLLLVLSGSIVSAQTDIDAIMMEKNAFCVGPMYSYSSWKNYWEGTLKRKNLNLGKVSTQMYGVMGNYGITCKLNALVQCALCKNQGFGRYSAWHGGHTGP